jgi:hypothetical protein
VTISTWFVLAWFSARFCQPNQLLRLAQEGARPPRPLPHPRGGASGRVRLREGVLQSAAPALGPVLPYPGRGAHQHGKDHHARSRMTFRSHPPTPRGQVQSLVARIRHHFVGLVSVQDCIATAADRDRDSGSQAVLAPVARYVESGMPGWKITGLRF